MVYFLFHLWISPEIPFPHIFHFSLFASYSGKDSLPDSH